MDDSRGKWPNPVFMRVWLRCLSNRQAVQPALAPDQLGTPGTELRLSVTVIGVAGAVRSQLVKRPAAANPKIQGQIPCLIMATS